MNEVARHSVGPALAALATVALVLLGCTASTDVTVGSEGRTGDAVATATAAPVPTPTAEPEAVVPRPTAEPEAVEPRPTAEPEAVEPRPTAEPEAVVATPTAEPEAVVATPTAEPEAVEPEPEWSVLGTFDPRSRLRRVYVLVPPGMTEAELTELAHTLRAEADADPANAETEGVEHYVMDDDSQFATLLAELPRTEEGDTSNWPTEYVGDHTVAYTKLYLLPDGDGGVDRAYILCFDLWEGCDVDNPPARWDQ